MLSLCLVMLVITSLGYAYDADSSALQLPKRYLTKVTAKTEKVSGMISKKSERVLSRLDKLERKMRRRFSGKMDSASLLFLSDSSGKVLLAKLKNSSTMVRSAYIDSLNGILGFLGSYKGLKDVSGTITNAKLAVNSLQEEMAKARDIRRFISLRQTALRERFAGIVGMDSYLKKYNKEAYYYGAQLREYRAMLSDRKKIESKALEMISKLPAYRDLLTANPAISTLMGNWVPIGGGVSGLQTRSLVAGLLRQRFPASVMSQGTEALVEMADGNLSSDRMSGGGLGEINRRRAAAEGRLNSIRSSASQDDGENGTDTAGFKISQLKTKALWQRLEYGGNIQFQKATYYFPATSDLAAQLAYRFHENGSIGLGVAYKIGLGEDWGHIRLSNTGASLRSFVEWKLKNTFYLYGGTELNRLSLQRSGENAIKWYGWQTSALAGLSRKYKVSSYMKGNIAILYDFLARYYVPRTPTLKIRMGYTF